MPSRPTLSFHGGGVRGLRRQRTEPGRPDTLPAKGGTPSMLGLGLYHAAMVAPAGSVND